MTFFPLRNEQFSKCVYDEEYSLTFNKQDGRHSYRLTYLFRINVSYTFLNTGIICSLWMLCTYLIDIRISSLTSVLCCLNFVYGQIQFCSNIRNIIGLNGFCSFYVL